MVTSETRDDTVFLGLCLDDELLRLEFEAIIADEFPTPPTRTPRASCRRRRSSSVKMLPPESALSVVVMTVVGREGPGQGRSPPRLGQ